MRTAALSVVFLLTACGGGTDTQPTTGTPTGEATGTGTGTGTTTTTTTSTSGAPVARDDVTTLYEGERVGINVLANDTDPNNALDPTSIQLIDTPSYGTATIVANGIQYTHTGSEQPEDSLTYTVRNDDGLVSNVAIVTLVVLLVDDPPLALPDSGTVDEGGATIVNVAANDTDADNTIDLGSVQIALPPARGFASPNADGTVTYVHSGADGDTDEFSYTIRDSGGTRSNQAFVTLTVIDINDRPTAVDDNDYCSPGEFRTLQPTANDIDPDDGLAPGSLRIITPPVNGTAVSNPVDNGVLYTHNGSNTYTDSFTYTVTDTTGWASNVATVHLSIVEYVPPSVRGSFLVNSGPAWTSNPPVQNCLQTCALVFGGLPGDYQCSSSNVSINRQSYSSSWGVGGCNLIPDTYSLDQGNGYNCGFGGCATSTWVADNCTGAVPPTYCWLVPFP